MRFGSGKGLWGYIIWVGFIFFVVCFFVCFGFDRGFFVVILNFFGFSWILGRVLVWSCLGFVCLVVFKRERVLGYWVVIVIVFFGFWRDGVVWGMFCICSRRG